MTSKLSYTLDGSGEKTLVMLHGWGMSKESFSLVANKFNTKAKCLIVDFYGFGDSGMPEEYYDTYEYAYQIFLLLKKLKIGKIILVGHSFGGRVAIILSSIFDIEIEGLILTSSAGLNRFDIVKNTKVIIYKIKKVLAKCGLYSTEKLKNQGSGDYRKLDPIMKSCFVKIVNQDLSYLLCKIKVKTSLFWAQDDRSTPIWICKKLNRCISNSSAKIFKVGGHFVYLKRMNSFINLIDSVFSNK